MEFAHLIFKNVLRHKLRSLLTVLGIALAIGAFGLLRTVISAWYGGVEASAPDRLITRNAISLAFPLPVAYKERIESVPGVEQVSFANWFGGIYIDEKHSMFPQFAVEGSKTWFDIFSEFELPSGQLETFLRERNAAIVGAKLADRFGWRVGDRIQMRGTFFSGDWDFVIRGIYRGRFKTTDETWFMFHWTYVDERLRRSEPERAGYVGWFVAKIADPSLSAAVSRSIDERFSNSLAETLTETEKAFQQGFVSMSDAIINALQVVSLVIIGVMLAVLSNTMAMAARERISEFAVLKTLGFNAVHLTMLVLGESILIALLGGILGMALIYPAASGFEKALGDLMGAIFPVFEVKATTLLLAALMVIAVGVTSGIFPTYRAVTLRIAQGLRRLG